MANEVRVLESMGKLPGQKRFLNGHTQDGTVDLAPSIERPFTGTRWRIRTQGDVCTLECLGELPGPKFLDGLTQNGTVGLAPHTDHPFTGTRWRMKKVAQNQFTFECLGHLPGNRFLDGRTQDGTVGLAPHTDPPFTGTLWHLSIPFGDDSVAIPADE
jgi:hypothetical protein